MLTRKRMLASGKPLVVKVKTPELGDKDEHTFVRELTQADWLSYADLLDSIGKDPSRGFAVWVFLCQCDDKGIRTYLDKRDVGRLETTIKGCGVRALNAYARIASRACQLNTDKTPSKNRSAPKKRSRSGSRSNSGKKTRGR